MKVVAVLDACVLFPNLLCDTLLRVAENGLYQVHWTKEILDEVQRNLIQENQTTEAKARRRIEHMEAAFEDALVTGYESRIPEMTNHPKDRHVLAAAVTCQAPIIVTKNLKDFLPAALDPFGIKAQTPDVFLKNLALDNQDRMQQIIQQQAGEYQRPATTYENLLDSLARELPEFIKFLR